MLEFWGCFGVGCDLTGEIYPRKQCLSHHGSILQ
jgi:hypothetical protein